MSLWPFGKKGKHQLPKLPEHARGSHELKPSLQAKFEAMQAAKAAKAAQVQKEAAERAAAKAAAKVEKHEPEHKTEPKSETKPAPKVEAKPEPKVEVKKEPVKAEKHSEKEKHPGAEEKKAKPEKKEKPKHKKLQRRSLGEYLEKAGYEITPDALKRKVKIILFALFGIATILLAIWSFLEGAAPLRIALFLVALWTAVLGAVYLLVWGVIYFFLDYRIYGRTQELEDVLPDYLQLASSNISAGMPIDRALWYAIRPNFGVLAKEMEDVAKATMAGEDLEVSLMRFSNKYDSTVLKRSINILIEGLNAGGEMADLLNKIALNIEEMKIMKKEMASSVTSYAIFITFASVIIAPVLFALATELLGIIIKITGSLDTGSGSSMISMGTPDPDAVSKFKTFSICMTIVTTVFSAALVSVIKKGNVIDGIKSIPIYALVALGIYLISSSVLHGMMGGIL